MKRAAMASASRSVLLADASKIRRVAFPTVAPMREVDVLVTDAPADEPLVHSLTDKGAEVIRVEPKPTEDK